MLILYLEAPFAVCRTFTAGWYRPTATFLTPSAAYGLLLNLAGIETRLREEDPTHPGTVPATVTRSGLPGMCLAVGAAAGKLRRKGFESLQDGEEVFPRVQTIYQQLHNYPVGASGGDRAARTFGTKYNISPVRREVLIGLRATIVAKTNDDVEARIRRSLAGESSSGRYGLPFIGDNAFLPDRIDLLDAPPPTYWYEQVTTDAPSIRPRTTRLTVQIDRADMSRTMSNLYAPAEVSSEQIPSDESSAWIKIPASLSE